MSINKVFDTTVHRDNGPRTRENNIRCRAIDDSIEHAAYQKHKNIVKLLYLCLNSN